MNLRKNIYFKPLCLLVAALLTGQCISVEKGKLISTEEKIIENGIEAYVYKLEKIKTPSAQNPTVEYRIVKCPVNRVESINTYKQRKINRSLPILLGVLAGAGVGMLIGKSQIKDSCQDLLKPYVGGAIGSLIGGFAGMGAGTYIGKKSDFKELIKNPTRNYLKKKSDSTPIPAQDFPLEFRWGISRWGTNENSNSFKTKTDEQGIVKINLIDDLKMTKLPFDHPLVLYILYLNPESQLKEILKDSLEPEK